MTMTAPRPRHTHASLRLLVLCALLLLPDTDAAAQTQTPQPAPLATQARTYTVGGRNIEVALTPDSPTVMVGEPSFLSFEIRNLSGVDLQTPVGGDYRNRLGRPDSFSITVTDEDGRTLPKVDAGVNMGGLMGGEKVPAGGSYVFHLFLPHWAVFKRPGEYTVVCEKRLSIAEDGKLFTPGEGERAAAEVTVGAKIKVVARDEAAMGEVIERYGKQLAETMIVGRGGIEAYRESRDALEALVSIDDARVVPHLVAVMRSSTGRFDYLKYKAAPVLAKFDEDDALAALADNIGDSNDSMRQTVAGALSQSKHPRAHALMLSMRRDKYYGVRLTIVHALSKMDAAASSPLLREMSKDENEQVRGEAARYLRERGEQLR